jgi:prepilin-type N-terminal cleavage/methylation domain-containing protein
MNIKNHFTNKSQGFTIVELLIVVVVIAILAAITIVSYNGIQARASYSKKVAEMSTIVKKVNEYSIVKSDQFELSKNGAAITLISLGLQNVPIVIDDSTLPLNGPSCTTGSAMTKKTYCVSALGGGSGQLTIVITYWHDLESTWKTRSYNSGTVNETNAGNGAYPQMMEY